MHTVCERVRACVCDTHLVGLLVVVVVQCYAWTGMDLPCRRHGRIAMFLFFFSEKRKHYRLAAYFDLEVQQCAAFEMFACQFAVCP